jgi:signal transduction histidine kinase
MTVENPPASARDPSARYAAVAAHQLGEVVALVRGASTMLDTRREQLGPVGGDALRAIASAADRGQRFIDDLLELARVGTNDLGVPGADLAEALAEACVALDVASRRPAVRVTYRGPPATAALGPHEARRILVHLLRVALAAGARRLHVVSESSEGVETIEIADDGLPPPPGADPLQPFSGVRGLGPLVGAGVGLAICRRIVERRGGVLELTPGADATIVTIRLPAVKPYV